MKYAYNEDIIVYIDFVNDIYHVYDTNEALKLLVNKYDINVDADINNLYPYMHEILGSLDNDVSMSWYVLEDIEHYYKISNNKTIQRVYKEVIQNGK